MNIPARPVVREICRSDVPLKNRAHIPSYERSFYAPAGGTLLNRDLAAGKSIMPFPKKKLYMRYPGIFLFLVVVACIVVAGCTQSSGTGPVTTAVPVTSPSPAESVTPAPTAETTVPTAAATVAPQQVVTIVHQISQVRDVKDSQLLFSLQVPVEWNISTYRIANPENFVGFMYQTDLVRNNTFSIHTFTDYRSREQNYRDECRRWVPAPDETVVIINGITFDRFESTANATTNVTYVARKNSVNEFGYLSVLAFSANTSNRFEKEDYDKVVSSFRYYGREDISTMPGEEILRLAGPQEAGASAHSAVGGSSSGSSSSSSSGGSSSGGGGGGGGGCHR
jgi:uncharacterized membrane protein YgcG